MDARVFTLEEVNALVPRLQTAVGRQIALRASIEALLARLGRQLGGEVPERIVMDPADPTDVRELKRDLVSELETYRTGWLELEEMGAVLKDPRTGLLDFYGEVDGKLVWLCWKYGEESISHYHALNEGFSARKPIGSTVKRHLLN